MYDKHPHFDKVYSGDMLVYDEKNGDNWSGYYGSKPFLKTQIKWVFNLYRQLELLMFLAETEV